MSVSDREISSKPVNEMSRTLRHTHTQPHTHTLHPSHPLLLLSSGGESAVINLANWTGKPAVCFYMKPLLWQQQLYLSFPLPPLPPHLSSLPLFLPLSCYLQFLTHSAFNIVLLQLGVALPDINMTEKKINIYFKSSWLNTVTVCCVFTVSTAVFFNLELCKLTD